MLNRCAPLVLATLLAACGGGACGGGEQAPAGPKHPLQAPGSQVGATLAKVNDLPIGTAGIAAEASRKPPTDGSTYSLEEKRQLLDSAIRDEILFQEAFRRGLYQDPKVRRILVSQLLREAVYEDASRQTPSDEAMRSWFEENGERFTVPERRHLRRIFIRINAQQGREDALARAQEILAKAKAAPDTFGDLAREHSEDAYASRDGDLGYLPKEGKPGVPTEVVLRGYGLNLGEISEPFLADGGYNLVQLAGKRDRLERSFEQVKGAVSRAMQMDRFEKLTETFVSELKRSANVTINEAALDAFQPPTGPRPGTSLPGVGQATPDAPPANAPEIRAVPGSQRTEPRSSTEGAARTGDPIRDLGDRNQEMRALMEADAAEEAEENE